MIMIDVLHLWYVLMLSCALLTSDIEVGLRMVATMESPKSRNAMAFAQWKEGCAKVAAGAIWLNYQQRLICNQICHGSIQNVVPLDVINFQIPKWPVVGVFNMTPRNAHRAKSSSSI